MVQPARFSASAALKSAAWAGAAGLGLSAVKAFTGFGIPCPWRALTGLLCPFCGATTLGVNLLHGEVAAAWSANQFVFVLLIGYAGAILAWIVEALGGPALRPPRRLRSAALWSGVLGVIAVGFAVARNLVG